MEVGVQSRPANQISSRYDVQTDPASEPVAPPQHDDEPDTQDAAGRHREEMRMLFLGFGTGITVALIFLVYIVIAYSGVLP
jgi:hypothetical protein